MYPNACVDRQRGWSSVDPRHKHVSAPCSKHTAGGGPIHRTRERPCDPHVVRRRPISFQRKEDSRQHPGEALVAYKKQQDHDEVTGQGGSPSTMQTVHARARARRRRCNWICTCEKTERGKRGSARTRLMECEEAMKSRGRAEEREVSVAALRARSECINTQEGEFNVW